MKLDKTMIDSVVALAKDQAKGVMKELQPAVIEGFVQKELQRFIEPLEQEIQATSSLWVKFRNRMYISVMRHSAKSMVAHIMREIEKL